MAELTRAQAADKAGVQAEYVDRLIEAGIIVPDAYDRLTTGNVRQIQMAMTLQGAGIGLETLASGIASGRLSLGFMDHPTYQRFATLSDETFREVSERSGVPVELLMVGREATGGAVPTPDDLRAFAGRDWGAIAESKARYAAELTPEQRLWIAFELAQHASSLCHDAHDERARRRDHAAHRRLADALRRVPAQRR